MDQQQTFHRRQSVVPVMEPESARNARVVQHLVSVVEDPCGRPAVPVAAVADRPVPDAEAAVWMLLAEPAAGIVEAVVEIPANSAVEAVVSPVVFVMARVWSLMTVFCVTGTRNVLYAVALGNYKTVKRSSCK